MAHSALAFSPNAKVSQWIATWDAPRDVSKVATGIGRPSLAIKLSLLAKLANFVDLHRLPDDVLSRLLPFSVSVVPPALLAIDDLEDIESSDGKCRQLLLDFLDGGSIGVFGMVADAIHVVLDAHYQHISPSQAVGDSGPVAGVADSLRTNHGRVLRVLAYPSARSQQQEQAATDTAHFRDLSLSPLAQASKSLSLSSGLRVVAQGTAKMATGSIRPVKLSPHPTLDQHALLARQVVCSGSLSFLARFPLCVFEAVIKPPAALAVLAVHERTPHMVYDYLRKEVFNSSLAGAASVELMCALGRAGRPLLEVVLEMGAAASCAKAAEDLLDICGGLPGLVSVPDDPALYTLMHLGEDDIVVPHIHPALAAFLSSLAAFAEMLGPCSNAPSDHYATSGTSSGTHGIGTGARLGFDHRGSETHKPVCDFCHPSTSHSFALFGMESFFNSQPRGSTNGAYATSTHRLHNAICTWRVGLMACCRTTDGTPLDVVTHFHVNRHAVAATPALQVRPESVAVGERRRRLSIPEVSDYTGIRSPMSVTPAHGHRGTASTPVHGTLASRILSFASLFTDPSVASATASAHGVRSHHDSSPPCQAADEEGSRGSSHHSPPSSESHRSSPSLSSHHSDSSIDLSVGAHTASEVLTSDDEDDEEDNHDGHQLAGGARIETGASGGSFLPMASPTPLTAMHSPTAGLQSHLSFRTSAPPANLPPLALHVLQLEGHSEHSTHVLKPVSPAGAPQAAPFKAVRRFHSVPASSLRWGAAHAAPSKVGGTGTGTSTGAGAADVALIPDGSVVGGGSGQAISISVGVSSADKPRVPALALSLMKGNGELPIDPSNACTSAADSPSGPIHGGEVGSQVSSMTHVLKRAQSFAVTRLIHSARDPGLSGGVGIANSTATGTHLTGDKTVNKTGITTARVASARWAALFPDVPYITAAVGAADKAIATARSTHSDARSNSSSLSPQRTLQVAVVASPMDAPQDPNSVHTSSYKLPHASNDSEDRPASVPEHQLRMSIAQMQAQARAAASAETPRLLAESRSRASNSNTSRSGVEEVRTGRTAASSTSRSSSPRNAQAGEGGTRVNLSPEIHPRPRFGEVGVVPLVAGILAPPITAPATATGGASRRGKQVPMGLKLLMTEVPLKSESGDAPAIPTQPASGTSGPSPGNKTGFVTSASGGPASPLARQRVALSSPFLPQLSPMAAGAREHMHMPFTDLLLSPSESLHQVPTIASGPKLASPKRVRRRSSLATAHGWSVPIEVASGNGAWIPRGVLYDEEHLALLRDILGVDTPASVLPHIESTAATGFNVPGVTTLPNCDTARAAASDAPPSTAPQSAVATASATPSSGSPGTITAGIATLAVEPQLARGELAREAVGAVPVCHVIGDHDQAAGVGAETAVPECDSKFADGATITTAAIAASGSINDAGVAGEPALVTDTAAVQDLDEQRLVAEDFMAEYHHRRRSIDVTSAPALAQRRLSGVGNEGDVMFASWSAACASGALAERPTLEESLEGEARLLVEEFRSNARSNGTMPQLTNGYIAALAMLTTRQSSSPMGPPSRRMDAGSSSSSIATAGNNLKGVERQDSTTYVFVAKKLHLSYKPEMERLMAKSIPHLAHPPISCVEDGGRLVTEAEELASQHAFRGTDKAHTPGDAGALMSLRESMVRDTRRGSMLPSSMTGQANSSSESSNVGSSRVSPSRTLAEPPQSVQHDADTHKIASPISRMKARVAARPDMPANHARPAAMSPLMHQRRVLPASTHHTGDVAPTENSAAGTPRGSASLHTGAARDTGRSTDSHGETRHAPVLSVPGAHTLPPSNKPMLAFNNCSARMACTLAYLRHAASASDKLGPAERLLATRLAAAYNSTGSENTGVGRAAQSGPETHADTRSSYATALAEYSRTHSPREQESIAPSEAALHAFNLALSTTMLGNGRGRFDKTVIVPSQAIADGKLTHGTLQRIVEGGGVPARASGTPIPLGVVEDEESEEEEGEDEGGENGGYPSFTKIQGSVRHRLVLLPDYPMDDLVPSVREVDAPIGTTFVPSLVQVPFSSSMLLASTSTIEPATASGVARRNSSLSSVGYTVGYTRGYGAGLDSSPLRANLAPKRPLAPHAPDGGRRQSSVRSLLSSHTDVHVHARTSIQRHKILVGRLLDSAQQRLGRTDEGHPQPQL